MLHVQASHQRGASFSVTIRAGVPGVCLSHIHHHAEGSAVEPSVRHSASLTLTDALLMMTTVSPMGVRQPAFQGALEWQPHE